MSDGTTDLAALQPTPQADSVRRVLVADDTFASRQLLGRLLLQFADVQISEARDGVAAVDQFALVRPGLTFLDIDMPRKSGVEVLKEIRAIDPSAYVVMVSGDGSLATVQSTLALGIGGYIVKPYSARRILDVLAKYAAEAGAPQLLRRA